tara:strand:- start:334 stop:489 length:156 start_codon:yes stop_codon:yes gene_type:complete
MLVKKFADALFIEIIINNIEKNTVFDLIYLRDILLKATQVFLGLIFLLVYL